MRKTWGALGAGVLALVLIGATFDTAEAHRYRGWHGGGAHFSGRAIGPRFVGRPYIGHRHFAGRHYWPRRHVRRGFFVGVPLLAYGAYSYGYGGYYGYGGCRWLKLRALETGSPYWWRRYEACRYDYYY
ncbi:MAG TPA: hypothetical protein VJ740_00720 [Hyphomicrobiaceae bacterium]|jgi:hypothetical protein|nr:hypothetical protein [Hyphomicrobiaceae bacterium]